MPIMPAEYEHLAQQMLEAYEEAERAMLKRVSRRVAKGVTTPGWTEKKQSETKAVRSELQAALNALKSGRDSPLKKAIAESYAAGAQSFMTEVERFTTLLGVSHISPSTLKVARILSELSDTLNAADRVILRKANDAYASIVGTVSAQVATGTITVREAVKQEVNRFADRGITSFVDKAGRAWEMATYAEMATITAIENATLAGYTDTMQSYGFDLAVISSHWGACPLCVAWEGVIVSVSGKDSKYPSLDDARAGGAFHPRCLHNLSTYYPGVTKGTRSKPRRVAKETPKYATRQTQRRYEREVRHWKRRMAAATTPEEERIALAHIRDYQHKIKELVHTAPKKIGEWLPRKYWREGGTTPKLSVAAKKLPPITFPKTKIGGIINPKPITFPKKRSPSPAMAIKTIPKSLENFKKYQSNWKAKYFDPELNATERQYLSDQLETLFTENDFGMRVWGVYVDDIADHGFKNQFQTGTSGGTLSTLSRTEATKHLFDADTAAMKPAEFERYGYLVPRDTASAMITDTAVRKYGDTLVKFKRDAVIDRLTFTVGDSLGPSGYGNLIAGSVKDASITGFARCGIKSLPAQVKSAECLVNNPSMWQRQVGSGWGYVELQYHGDLSISDVESICFDDNPPEQFDQLVRKLKDKGVTVKQFKGGKLDEL